MKPLVITSMNPRGRFGLQKKCFDRWGNLGLQAVTYNIEGEAEELVRLGVDRTSIVSLKPNETALALHKTPAPLIRTVLERVSKREDTDSILLVNSDIYPAIRKSGSLFAQLAPCAAFTRREVLSLRSASVLPKQQYRGGLDIFFFSHDSLQALLSSIRNDDAFGRMAFGVPGWDFYLGAHVVSPPLNGKILDAPFLLHISHPTTYSNISELGYYVESLLRLGVVTTKDYTIAARQFATVIEKCCNENSGTSRMMELMYLQYGCACGDDVLAADTMVAAKLRDANQSQAPSQRVAAYALAQLACEREVTYEVLRAFCVGDTNCPCLYTAQLRALRTYLALHAEDPRRRVNTVYPRGNLHGKVIEGFLSITDKDALRRQVLDLFARELADHKVFSKRLLKYLFLSCRNDEERELLQEISAFIKGMVHETAN